MLPSTSNTKVMFSGVGKIVELTSKVSYAGLKPKAAAKTSTQPSSFLGIIYSSMTMDAF